MVRALIRRLIVLIILVGCEFKKNVSKDEIPIIKESIVALENVIRAHSAVYLDSILSNEAAAEGMTPEIILDLVYGDGLEEFVGFTQKQIFFRGDAARVDCKITGPNGPVKDITITLRYEDDVWLIKKIAPKTEDPTQEDDQ